MKFTHLRSDRRLLKQWELCLHDKEGADWQVRLTRCRQARLQRMTDRLADETAEEREARLQQTTASNYARLAAETAEERGARLQSDRLRHRQQQVAGLPLFFRQSEQHA